MTILKLAPFIHFNVPLRGTTPTRQEHVLVLTSRNPVCDTRPKQLLGQVSQLKQACITTELLSSPSPKSRNSCLGVCPPTNT